MATLSRMHKIEIQKPGSWRFPAQNGSAPGAGRGLGRAHAWAERRRSEPPWLKVVFAAIHQRAGALLAWWRRLCPSARRLLSSDAVFQAQPVLGSVLSNPGALGGGVCCYDGFI